MNLHQNENLFKDAVFAASQRFGIPEIYIEKDYWATLVLNEIFHSDVAGQIVSKEGPVFQNVISSFKDFQRILIWLFFKRKEKTTTS